MKKKKLIVFDMDGVLIDVSGSYRETVRQTAGLFFKPAPSSEKLRDPLFPLKDLAAVKQSGGLNNDWDLSCRVISLLFDVIEKPTVYERKNPWERYRETIRRCHVEPLAEFLESSPSPLSALLGKAGEAQNTFINGLYTGDVGSGNIIKQIFQEVYLGKDLFEATYGLAPQFYFEEGYNHREQLLIDTQMLAELAENHIAAIATGRPRAEAHYPLDHFGIRRYFEHVMAPRGRSSPAENGVKKGIAEQTRPIYAGCHRREMQRSFHRILLHRRYARRHNRRQKISGRVQSCRNDHVGTGSGRP